jgi:hypothetical protein
MHEKNVPVILIRSWSEVTSAGGWDSWSKKHRFGAQSVVLVDEAQSSYKEDAFWFGTVKPAMDPICPYRIVLFASYGSPVPISWIPLHL